MGTKPTGANDANTTEGGVGPTNNEKTAGDDALGDIPTEKEKFEVLFDEKLGKEKDTRKLVRYQLNPRENWGPMNRAKGKA